MKTVNNFSRRDFIRSGSQQAIQMDDFATCVQQNKSACVPGQEELKDIKVLDAIYRSLDPGKKEKV